MDYVPIRKRYAITDVFFADGDRICNAHVKQTTVDEDPCEEFLHKHFPEFCCHIAGCVKTFTTVCEYERHYNSQHRHVCEQCKKLFPTANLLEVHILETHDILFGLMSRKQHMHMYACLVEDCSEKFKNSLDRDSHLTKVHRYPHDFRFNRTVPKKPGKARDNKDSMDYTEDENTNNVSSKPIKYVPKIPKEICFGHGSSRCFETKKIKKKSKTKHWHQMHQQMDTSVDIENIAMKDLMEFLPQ